MATTSDLAIQLFTYLKELAKLRTTHIKNISNYDEVLWFSDIPREKFCNCIAWDLWTERISEKEDRGDVWIEIHKPTIKSAPEVPDDLEPWIKDEERINSALQEPGLYDEITNIVLSDPDTGEEQTEILSINDHPEIFEMWVNFVDTKWKPWAEEDKRLQKIQKVYNDIYTIYQRSEKLGEQYEVVVGLGFLQWRSSNSGEIRHPLLVFQAKVSFDRVRGIISVGPALNGAEAKLEIDMLETEDRPEVQDQKAIQDMIDELNGIPWDGIRLESILKSLANSISSESRYDRSISRSTDISEIPKIDFSPLLILRKRTHRAFVDFYEKILDRLKAGEEVSDNVRRLVEIVEDSGQHEEEINYEQSRQVLADDREIYFPLPANDEQKQIVRFIERQRGVLVQGPPGTGKSHTIANLVSHLLAKGNRVLITSETPRALEVLKDMLPEEIQELCVLWLGSGPQAQKSLEGSVSGITQKKIHWNSELSNAEITKLEQRLDQTRTSLAKLWGELTAYRESETYEHSKINELYSGTFQKIAIQINKEREQFGWFLDRPALDEKIPISSDDLDALLQVDRLMTEDFVNEINMRHLPMDYLLPPVKFKDLITNEKKALLLYEKTAKKRNYPGYKSLQKLPSDKRARMLELLRILINQMDDLGKYDPGWIGRAVQDIVSGQDSIWRHLLQITQENISVLEERSREISALYTEGIEGLNHTEVALHARELKDHLDSGKGLGLFGPFRAKVVKRAWYLVKKVRLDGKPCVSAEQLQKLINWLDFKKRLEELGGIWKPYISPLEGNYSAQLAAYEDLCKPLKVAISLNEIVQELRETISGLIDFPSPHWHILDNVRALRDAVNVINIDEYLLHSKRAFIPLEKNVHNFLAESNAHPATEQIFDAIQKRDISRYTMAYTKISNMNEQFQLYTKRCEILRSFQISCPQIASVYENSFQDIEWDQRFRKFYEASCWAKTERWLMDVRDKEYGKILIERINRHQKEEHAIITNLAAAKAWKHSMMKLGEAERMALIAWMQAVRKIRGGTGRHAERYREEARQKLTECRKAIPAWVMPLYQVVQTIIPQKEAFDVVIIDEASQSGPEALLLNYIGKKIIVVGDDKQIAPINVGVNRDEVVRLRQIYLQGIPHNEAFDLEGSFFSQAELRFPGRVRLREHFRCMPEIIKFSNDLSYNTEPLIPLRQFGADRLEPLKTTHVKNGYRKGRSPNIVNEREAESLVNQIVQCIEDPAYDGKSFGVISLLGDSQANYISKLLMQEVGAEQIERRDLLCGTPYDFQGDERDVIFLSMVDAPEDGRTCRMVRDAETQRRFNVAASRAKDQLWLFHSPTLNELRSDCLRYRLLEHCLNRFAQPITIGGLDLEELRHLVKSESRDVTNAPEPFDSWFEVDVFIRIAERGYRVLPQHKVAGYRIDFVIEGLESKLAIECDGDKWHGPEQFNKDMERQRQLERCGWSFWRVGGCQYYREPNEALQILWETLERLKIYPEQQWAEERHKKEETHFEENEEYSINENDVTINAEDIDNDFEEPSDNVTDTFETSTVNRKKSTDVSKGDRLERILAYDRAMRRQRPETLSAISIQKAIIAALSKCPNNTCTEKSITSRVLKELDVVTRGNPRAEFETRVKRNIGTLKRKGLVEEYKAKNKRLRLLDGVSDTQEVLRFND